MSVPLDIEGRNINNPHYTGDTMLIAENTNIWKF